MNLAESRLVLFLLPLYLSTIASNVVNTDQFNFVKVSGQPLVANIVEAVCTDCCIFWICILQESYSPKEVKWRSHGHMGPMGPRGLGPWTQGPQGAPRAKHIKFFLGKWEASV